MFKFFSIVLTGLSSLFGLTVGLSIGIALGTVFSVGSVFVVTLQESLVENALHAQDAWHTVRNRMTQLQNSKIPKLGQTN